MRWTVVCDECGEKATFADAKDIAYAKWTVLAWKVPSGEPLCVCNECEYGKPKPKKPKEKPDEKPTA